jgi:hypothetical protein
MAAQVTGEPISQTLLYIGLSPLSTHEASLRNLIPTMGH